MPAMRTPVMRGLALTAFLLLACAREGTGTPDAAYRAFARAASERDADRAWTLLSADTQAWLDRRAKTAAAAAPGVVAGSGRQLLFGDAALATTRPLTTTLVLRESRDEAVVEVAEEGGPKREVVLVREGGWRVRIPDPDGAR
ncbi:MAG: hypothetical protein A2V77_00060 [Anaeromyxobacter sp. RBG_16_69_14]|nr:MAG: hypothetical protein A2V77_00060 [Anaeromyxobacter sp. RBG_16_69_14]